MSDQAYLTIGEVLGLLLEEFPDVTVSKIRFLESQGLVEPERSAAGYRKFSDHDVERLRYVMREQRNHYLPLRVIKDRLNESDLTSPGGPRPVPTGAAWATVEGGSDAVRNIVERANELARGPAQPDLQAGRGTAPEHPGAHSAESEPPAPSPPVAEPDPAPPTGLRLVRPAARREPPLEVVPDRGPTNKSQAPLAVAPAARGADWSLEPAAEDASAVDASGDHAPADHSLADDAVAAREQEAEDRGASDDAELSEPVELSLIALMAATGASERFIVDLESYGLLASREVGSGRVYDRSALDLVTIAKGFADRGIEARHLRTWRTNADKEIALFEQLVVPLVRQRNPHSRDQAAQLVGELSRLGAELRRHLVAGGLRQYLDR